ncbi:RES domain-containing protein [Thiocystis violacea]|uniref:RES domain-containing protein n=1 Tax=Thiocystis violacea TaxID=13725 RepID=UPI0034E1EE37
MPAGPSPRPPERAARHGGRFNPRGTPVLYTSLDPRTAWTEAQQGLAFKARAMTLVGYRVGGERIVDLTDPALLATCAVEAATLVCLLGGTGLARSDAAERPCFMDSKPCMPASLCLTSRIIHETWTRDIHGHTGIIGSGIDRGGGGATRSVRHHGEPRRP